jgi:hypothetical protein
MPKQKARAFAPVLSVIISLTEEPTVLLTDPCPTTIKRGDAPRASVGKSPTLKSKSETLRKEVKNGKIYRNA